MSRPVVLAAACLALAGCGPGPGGNALEEARVLRGAGHFVEALALYEEAIDKAPSYDPELWVEYAETALLASGAERSRTMRQKALEALVVLGADTTMASDGRLGEMWRRLAWDMVRDRDSLQAYSALGNSLDYPGMTGVFEEEWLIRGAYASRHLSQVAGLPDSLALTPAADSILEASAELHLVELSRIPLVRTDLRRQVLEAEALLLPFTDRAVEELEVLTELDRMGGMDPSLRERRMRLLLSAAGSDIGRGDNVMARERLLEVWSSDFSSDRVEAALLLGIMAETAGRPSEALDWYRSACAASPGLASPASQEAAARRDSLMFILN